MVLSYGRTPIQGQAVGTSIGALVQHVYGIPAQWSPTINDRAAKEAGDGTFKRGRNTQWSYSKSVDYLRR